MFRLFVRLGRTHRQAQDFVRQPLGGGKAAGVITRVCIGLLQMGRIRIVDHRSDARIGKPLLERVAVLMAQDC